jgi:hypothetical protein
MTEKDHVFVVYVKKLPLKEPTNRKERFAQRHIKKGQDFLFNSLFKNLGGDKPPANEKEGMVFFPNTKELCESHNKEFWETGTVEVVKAANENIKAHRYPSWVRKSLLNIVAKNKDVASMFRMFCTYFSVIVASKVDTLEHFHKHKEDADYFPTTK